MFLTDANQHWNSMPPSPRGNDNMAVSGQNTLSYTNNYSQMPTLSPTEANPNIAHGLDYMQQCNEQMQIPVSNICQNDQNSINESTVYIADNVANSEFIDSDNVNNASQFEEHQESASDEEKRFRDSKVLTDDKRDYSPLPSSPKQFAGTDFRKEYVKIRDRDTRKRYKIEFSRNYDRYKELHRKIEKVSQRFANLKSQLGREREGSQSYKVRKKYQQ